MKTIELNEITGEIETHHNFECAHCSEPTERANAAAPTCEKCNQPVCPCCDIHNCQS